MEVIYADASILVVNKPSGLATTPGGWEKDSASLIDTLEEDFGHLWVVHRLDKSTSGLVVLARSAEAHRNLNTQFEHHEFIKEYHALVVGAPAWDVHTARHPLRMNVGHGHRTIVDNAGGKPSETNFMVLKRVDGYALLAANPISGRTHQIRAHVSALGFPLLGDTLYGSPETDLITRPALHAQSITFHHPETNQKISFSASYPQDLSTTLQRLCMK